MRNSGIEDIEADIVRSTACPGTGREGLLANENRVDSWNLARSIKVRSVTIWLAVLCFSGFSAEIPAHGGVVLEEDQCVINIGFLKAHFTVYQPEKRGNEEYCEDLPDAGETVFVLDYLHRSLKEMPVDFRIVRDTTELGRFATWEDVQGFDDIETRTVLYQPPVIRPDNVFMVEHVFAEPGFYIGIVTTRHPTLGKGYNAVFPFEVGATGFGYLPLFIVLVLLVQIQYLVSNGTIARWRAKFLNK